MWAKCVRVNMLMRLKTLPVSIVSVLALATLTAGPAQAESFFAKLFGWAASPPAKSEAAPPKRASSPGNASHPGSSRPPDSGSSDDDADYETSISGSYRTVCVRTCDGYYFPISAGTSSRNFARDERQCQTSCGGGEARLYYMPRGDDDVANMTDRSGRVYSKLPAAFAYRTSLVNGCSCRPMPWSQAEGLRHNHYALIDTLDNAQKRNAELARLAASSEPMDDSPELDAIAAKLAEVDAVVETASVETAPATFMMGHLLPSTMQEAMADDQILAPSIPVKRLRKSSVARNVRSPAKSNQVASWFSPATKFSWPGDTPSRRK